MTINKIILGLVCSLVLNTSEAKDNLTGNQQRNQIATRNYYSQLLSGTTARVAELSLLMNLLPKGADLHHHYSGAIYAETYLDWVGAQNFCIYRENNSGLKIEKFRIESKPNTISDAARALCSSADAVRQDNGFYRELLMRWSDKDYENHVHQQTPPDQHFFDTFGYFGATSGYAYQQGLLSLKARAQSENLGYLETMLKSGPSLDMQEWNARLNNLNPASSEQEITQTLEQAYAFLTSDSNVKTLVDNYLRSLEEAAKGIDDASFKLRFQAYTSRNNPPAKVFSSLYTSFASASRQQKVVGVNIVGPENGFVAMRDYALHMKMFALLKKHFPDVKLALHAGELSLGMVPPEGLRSHIHDAVVIAGASRIGHGVDIAHETNAIELLSLMKKRNIAIEINLTSNAFILGVKNEAHPVQLYKTHAVPFVISTDDAGVSRNNLSGEYLLYVSRYQPTYDELKQIVYNSITYSFLSEAEKREEHLKLDQRFRQFEAKIASLPRLKTNTRVTK